MEESIMEEREELMVPPKGGKPTRKLAHFIKPTLSFQEPNPEFPSTSLLNKPIFMNCTPNGWRNPTHAWISWVDRLHSTYKFIWQRAGIYDAILGSRYNIIKNEDLIFGFAERWCSETNTFVFPWGEATITLEDIMILGGYSVLGDSVCGSLENDEIVKKLTHIYEKLLKGPSKKASQGLWMKHFMEFGGENGIEHEGFLTLWLSRFVLPSFPYDMIVKKYFKFAVNLARGVRVALAPLVLASIYRDLSLLKSAMVNVYNSLVCESGKGDNLDDLFVLTLWAPLQFVQVWAWERFPVFRPKPRVIEYGEPRLARWDGVKKEDIGNVRPLLQSFYFDDDILLGSCDHYFEWRPYCREGDNLTLPCFYRDDEEVVIVSVDLPDDIKSMVRVLRVCELVGIDTLERYSPHRVAMQFGFDQDIPKPIDWGLMSSDIDRESLLQLAWINYTNPIRDEILYLPCKTYEPQVTMRYLKWIRQGALTRPAAFDGVLRKNRSLRMSRKSYKLGNFENVIPSINFRNPDMNRSFLSETTGNDLERPPVFSPQHTVALAPDVMNVHPGCALKTNITDASPDFMPNDIVQKLDFPPGFWQDSSDVGKQVDVPSETTPKSIALRDVNVPPGFEPNTAVLQKMVNVPSGFSQKLKASVKEENVPSTFTPKSIVAPPGFLPKTISSDLDFPPGFTPKRSRPTKSCAENQKVDVSESEVSVKKEHFDSTGNSRLLERHDDEPGEPIYSRAIGEESSGKVVQTYKHIIEGIHGGIVRKVADRGSHREPQPDLEARLGRIGRIVQSLLAELTRPNQDNYSSPI